MKNLVFAAIFGLLACAWPNLCHAEVSGSLNFFLPGIGANLFFDDGGYYSDYPGYYRRYREPPVVLPPPRFRQRPHFPPPPPPPFSRHDPARPGWHRPPPQDRWEADRPAPSLPGSGIRTPGGHRPPSYGAGRMRPHAPGSRGAWRHGPQR